jgi:hypothetical protein
VDGKLVDVSIGMTVSELIITTERIEYWKQQKRKGIDPPKSEMKLRESESYIDQM